MIFFASYLFCFIPTANFDEDLSVQIYSLCAVVQYFKCHKKEFLWKTNVKRYFLFNYTAAFIFFGKWKQGENTCRTSWYCFPLKYFLPFSYLDFYLMRKRRLKRQHQRFLSYNTRLFTIDVQSLWFDRIIILASDWNICFI